MLPAELRAEIQACGYFPAFITDAISRAVAQEEVLGYLVHHEATFHLDSVGRHLSVLVLTPTRLLIGHIDEGAIPGEAPHAITSVESIALRKIEAAAVSELVSDPQSYDPSLTCPNEAWLSIGWGTMRRIELEPASCGDPNCDADHGYSGSASSDDLTVRMSVAADGADKMRQLLAFGTLLQLATR
jgi:hypothetical protein